MASVGERELSNCVIRYFLLGKCWNDLHDEKYHGDVCCVLLDEQLSGAASLWSGGGCMYVTVQYLILTSSIRS